MIISEKDTEGRVEPSNTQKMKGDVELSRFKLKKNRKVELST